MKLTRTNLLACSLLGVTALASNSVTAFVRPSAVRHAVTKMAPPFSRRHDFSIFFNRVPDYAERQVTFGIADKDVLTETAKLGDMVLVDVRSLEEIAEASLDRPFVHGNFILKGELSHLTKILPSKTNPIIVFCAMGGRASTVKATLEEQGYQTVLNAGGLRDLDFLP